MRRATSAVIGFALLATALPVFAAPTSVDVPSECTVIDTDAVAHTYGGQYLGICALAAAKDQGAVLSYTLQNFSFGLFLQSLNGTTPGATEFWALYYNGAEASVGLTDLVVVEGDTITFKLTDFTSNTQIGPPVEFSIGSLIAKTNAPSHSSSEGGGEFLKDRVFNVESAFDFLVSKQRADGSFGSLMLTDWAAIAFGTAIDEVCNDACPAGREKLRAYLAHATIATSSATELERHIMALEALAIDPYVVFGSPVDALVAKFDGVQMGDPYIVNDDIFALFPLLHAGYAKTDSMVQAIVDCVLSEQRTNGSWEGSVDLTAAAIQALAPFSDDEKTGAAIRKAKEFIGRNQNDSGIFGPNSFTLSWALQAIAALKQTPADWQKSGVTPLGYLGVFQQQDGGVEPMSAGADTRVWATSYAIPAAFGKSWNDILHDFARPVLIEHVATSTDIRATTESSAASAPVPVETVESASTTETTLPDVAAAAEAASPNIEAWIWLSGLILILGATFFFLRRA